MPIILTPEMGNSGGGTLSMTGDMGYAYPASLDLRPSSRLHQLVLSRLLILADESHSVMQERYPSWNEIDNTLNAYIRLDDVEKKLKNRDERRPVSIVVPYSYATLETILTYMTEALLTQSPMFAYEGMGPEDQIGAKLLEVVVDFQLRYTKAFLSLHTILRDGLSYGMGIVAAGWDTRTALMPVQHESTLLSRLGDAVLRRTRTTEYEDRLVFEGSDLIRLDPYRVLPDPNVSIDEVQKGERFGWVQIDNIFNLLTAEETDPEEWFNIRYIKQRGASVTSRFTEDRSKRRSSSMSALHKSVYSFPVTLLNMYVNLVPRDWGLSPSERPEKWLFTIADDTVLVRAKPLGLLHGMYPVAVNAPDFDGYSVAPAGRIELTHGLQTALDWMFNSHIANVRKALNDMLVVDPALINMDDLLHPEPGKLIRLKRAAWGKGVKDAVMQLGVTDVTRQHVQDAAIIMDLMQKVSAATDATMGVVRSGGERRTATEYQSTVSNAISRLRHLSLVSSVMALRDVAFLCASHTQQLMSQPIWRQVLGSWPDVLKNEYGARAGVTIDPVALQIPFDVLPRDGTTPHDLGMTAQGWMQFFQIIAGNPALMQIFDVTKVFLHYARLSGAKDLHQFLLKDGLGAAQVAQDQMVADQARRGNLLPVAQAQQLMQGVA